MQKQDSCTLSIMMIDWIQSRASLPGLGPGDYGRLETATFEDIYGAARVVERDCLLPTRQPGWEVVGKIKHNNTAHSFHATTSIEKGGDTLYVCTYLMSLRAIGRKSSIGIFLWGTHSAINDQIIGERESFSNISLPNLLSPNASSNFANNIESTE